MSLMPQGWVETRPGVWTHASRENQTKRTVINSMKTTACMKIAVCLWSQNKKSTESDAALVQKIIQESKFRVPITVEEAVQRLSKWESEEPDKLPKALKTRLQAQLRREKLNEGTSAWYNPNKRHADSKGEAAATEGEPVSKKQKADPPPPSATTEETTTEERKMQELDEWVKLHTRDLRVEFLNPYARVDQIDDEVKSAHARLVELHAQFDRVNQRMTELMVERQHLCKKISDESIQRPERTATNNKQ